MPDLDSVPAELIERIADLANPSDLFALRVASSNIESKVSYSFMKEHISTRTCFVQDQASLHNLLEIVSNEKLSEEVRSLTFTTAPLYPFTSANVHLAAGPGCYAHPTAQDKAAASLTLESEKTNPDPIKQSTVAAILRKLKAIGECRLSLDLATPIVWSTSEELDPFDGFDDTAVSGPTRGCVAFMSKYESVYHDLLQVVAVGAEYDVKRIKIDDWRLVDVELLDPIGVRCLQRSMESLEEIHIIVSSVILDHRDDNHGNTLRDPRYGYAQRFILEAAEALQRLKLVGDVQMADFCCDKSFEPNLLNVATMLMVKPFYTLKDLCLEHISVPESVLLKILSNCARTLKHLTLSDIIIDSTSWRGIFIHLRRACHLLEHIIFKGLVTRQPNCNYSPTVFDTQMRQKQLHELPIDPYYDDGVHTHWKEHSTLEVRGLQPVQARLALLSTGDEHRELGEVGHLEDGVLVTESYEQWQRNGRGSPDDFGISNLVGRFTGTDRAQQT